MADDIKPVPGEFGPSLADLDNPDYKAPEPKEEIPPTETPEEKIIRETNEAKTKAEEEEAAAKLKAEEEAAAALKEKEEASTDDEDPEAATKFIEEVNKLHGFEDFKVEYPEGIDPLTPEGIHLREKAIMEHATKQFDEYLRESNPRAYAYMLHRQSGGSDEDFFATPSTNLPTYDTFKDNVDLQKQVYISDLKAKGVDEDIITAMVEKAVKDGKLFEKSDTVYKAIEANEKKVFEEADKKAKDRAVAEETLIKSTLTTIDDIVLNSKVDNIVIPDAKRAEFAEYLKKQLYFDGENFFMTKPISKETIAKVIMGEYFAFAGGDLKALVERRAKTENVNNLRIKVGKTATGPKGGTETPSKKDFIALGDL